MKGAGAGIRVGALVLTVAVVGWMLWKAISERSAGVGGYKLWGRFHNAAGLSAKSRVMIAGLTMGEIADRRLEGRLARVTVKVRKDTQVFSNAVMYKKSSSLLGEYYLEIDPGTPETAQADGTVIENRVLGPGDEIPTVIEATTPDELMRRVTDTLPRVDDVLVEVRGLAADARRLVNGPVTNMAQNLDRTVEQDAEIVDSILRRTDRAMALVESIAADIKVVTGSTRVDRIFANVEGATADFKALGEEARKELATTAATLRQGLERIDGSLASLDDTLDHSASIARKIDDDQGTLGRLVNDPTIADNVADITTSAKGFTDSLFGLKTIVGLRAEHNFWSESWKAYLSVELQPRPEKLYLVEVVADPRGRRSPREVIAPDPTTGAATNTITYENKFRFSFQFGRRFDWLTLRLGIKESTGGVGADADLWGRRLHLQADVFDTSFDQYPRLKLLAAYHFFKYAYIYGGVDDVLNAPGSIAVRSLPEVTGNEVDRFFFGRSFFVGSMLKFNDTDLTALLFVLGSALSGMAN